MFIDALNKVNARPDEILKYEGDRTAEYLLMWNWVKWYEGWEDYEDVNAVTNVMRTLDKYGIEDVGYGYKFLRLGEDDTDVESRTNNDNIELYFRREIDVPYGGVKL